jgi:hypothetical protein
VWEVEIYSVELLLGRILTRRSDGLLRGKLYELRMTSMIFVLKYG